MRFRQSLGALFQERSILDGGRCVSGKDAARPTEKTVCRVLECLAVARHRPLDPVRTVLPVSVENSERLDHWRSSYGISTYSGRRGCRFPERTDQIPNNRFSFQPVDFGMQVITQCLGIANTPRGSPPATRSIPGRRCRADCGSCEPRSTPRRAIAGACYPCFCGLVDCGNATSSRVLTMSRTYIMLC
jgi:hypothetical protein